MTEQIQFLVIGAQKSGTTSLFQYLKAHPSIYMPAKKEVAFFARDRLFDMGVSYYLSEFFGNVAQGQIAGEASPQYMCFSKCPERIANAFPEVKLLAVLRNPIDRAFSHYRMALRREYRLPTFADCIASQINRPLPADDDVDQETEFVSFGEYGRILSNYLRYFDRRQIQLVWSEELSSRTELVMQQIFRFLQVDDTFTCSAFDDRFHEGGERRFDGWPDRLISKILKRSEKYLGIRRAQAISHWYRTEVNVKRRKIATPVDTAYSLLQEHYREDIARLSHRFGVSPPWEAWAVQANEPIAGEIAT